MTEEQIDELEKLIKSPFFTNSQVCELVEYIRTLQQQNKQLIEALEEIKDEEWRLAGEFTTIYTTAYLAIQQIQGKDERE